MAIVTLSRSGRLIHLLVVPFVSILFFALPSFVTAQKVSRTVSSEELFTTPSQGSLAKATPIASPAVISVALRTRACEILQDAGTLLLRDFPMPDGSREDLRLNQFRVFSADAQFWSRTPDGEVRRPQPGISFYRGEVEGVEGSFVYIAVAEHDISGTIQRNGVNFSFTTMVNTLPTSEERILSIYQSTDEMSFYECGVDDDAVLEEYMRDLPVHGSLQTQGLDTLRASIAVDADYEAFQHFKTTAAAETYITTLVGHVTAIYERDVAIIIELTYMRVWETPDPYSGASDKDALNTFSDYWSENMGHVDRTIAQLISRKRISADGVSQGLAWVNQLCSKTRGYAFTKLSANNSWITGHVGVWAHEIGHNFGSPHTHSCLWNPPIDSCYTAEPAQGKPACFSSGDIHLILGGGEMMSYCHMRFGSSAKQNIFRNRVGGLVRARADAATCMSVTSTVRALALTSPVGGEQICGGSLFEITWTAQGNNDFSILLSTNGGSSFDQVLVADLPRSARSWTWGVPNDQAVGDQYRLKIVDNKLPELFSEMQGSFSILQGTYITDQVMWRNVCVGEGAWFYVRATGSGTLTYQWTKNGQPIDGKTTDELQLQNLQISDNLSQYTCIVTGDCGFIESVPALLKVFTGAVFTRNLENDTTCIGGSAHFSIEADGSNLTYKWFYFHSGQNRTIDVNAPELTIPNVQQSDIGSYWCEVSSSCGKSTSLTCFLIVPNKAITVLQPGVWDMIVPAGSQFMLGWKQFCINSVKIEYSIDNATQWLPISGSFDANAGEYLWNVPEVEAENCFIRLSDADNAGTIGLSKQFKIRNRPIFSLESPNVGFGWVDVGGSSEKPLVISNTGLADLEVSRTTITGSTSVAISNGAPFTVPAGGTYDLMLKYTPVAPVPMNAILRIDHNAAGSPTMVDVFGEAYIASAAPSLSRPMALTLLQSYPNPVTEGTPVTLTFDLPRAGTVTLTAFSLLGTEIRPLYTGTREAGRHNLTVTLRDYPAGAYIVRLTTAQGSLSRMLHIVR